MTATQIHEIIKDKAVITFLACPNYSGTERYPLMIVGHGKRPRSFGKKSEAELDFDYHFNCKTWMTDELFFAWLKRFDDYIGLTPNGRLHLLLDNCSEHGGPDVHPILKSVVLHYRPPNRTNHIQPIDVGNIATVKSELRL